MVEQGHFNDEFGNVGLNEAKEMEGLPSFDVAIVLGTAYKEGKEEREGGINLDMESKMRVLAVGELAKEGKINKILFSGGEVYGVEKPVAEGMRDYFLKKYPQLSGIDIELESESMDTNENAENIAKIIDKQNMRTAIILSNQAHLKRATEIFKRKGLAVIPMEAEEEMAERSNHHKVFSERYLKSWRNQHRAFTENLLRMVMFVDKDGKLMKALAKKQRK